MLRLPQIGKKKDRPYTTTDISDANNEKGDITLKYKIRQQDAGPKYKAHRSWDMTNVFWVKMLSPTHVMTIYHQFTKKALIVHHWKINLDDKDKPFTVASWFSMESDLLDREPVTRNRNTLACVKNRCGMVLTFLPQKQYRSDGPGSDDLEYFAAIHQNPGDAAIFIFGSDVGTKDYQVSDTLNKDDFGYQKDKTTPHRDLFKPTSNYPGKGWMRSASIVAMSGLGMATDHTTKDKKKSASFFVTFNEWFADSAKSVRDYQNPADKHDALTMDRWSIFIQEKEYDSELHGGFGYTKSKLKPMYKFFKIDASGYCVTYDMKEHYGHSGIGRTDAAQMMNHEHVFTVNNPAVHTQHFYMTFVMMASESKDGKFVINPKGKH